MSTDTTDGVEALLEITATADCLRVAGEIDASTCDVFRDALTAASLIVDGPVVVDMEQVDFIDSSGIGVLVGTFKSRPDGMTILHPSRAVERVLRLTGLYERFVGTADH